MSLIVFYSLSKASLVLGSAGEVQNGVKIATLNSSGTCNLYPGALQ